MIRSRLVLAAALLAASATSCDDEPGPAAPTPASASSPAPRPSAPPGQGADYADADLVVAAELEEQVEKDVVRDNYKERLAAIQEALGIEGDEVDPIGAASAAPRASNPPAGSAVPPP